MKNCPMCGHEYYDEARWCPDCEYDFPAGPPAPPPERDDVARALEKIAAGQEAGAGPAAAVAQRLDELFRAANGDPNEVWKLSPEHLKHVREYEMAAALLDLWKKKAKPR